MTYADDIRTAAADLEDVATLIEGLASGGTTYTSLSLGGIANSAMGSAIGAGNWGFSLSNLSYGYSLSGTETTAANIAKVLANLIKALGHRGIIRVTGTGV